MPRVKKWYPRKLSPPPPPYTVARNKLPVYIKEACDRKLVISSIIVVEELLVVLTVVINLHSAPYVSLPMMLTVIEYVRLLQVCITLEVDGSTDREIMIRTEALPGIYF